jgi:mono/diheme cytochrome c family protein
MKLRWSLLLGFVAIGLLAAASFAWQRAAAPSPVVINGTAVPPLPRLAPVLAAQGEALYAQYCAACHGMNLEGAPNWKQRLADGSYPPPPHNSSGHTWHHSDAVLLNIISNGGDPALNSKMPPFRGRLNQEGMNAILEFFKSRWGQEEREYQWWITATGNDLGLLELEK